MEEILKQIEEQIEKPFVTARFGNTWKEHTKQLFDSGEIDIENIIDIAWRQGRIAILLEQKLQEYKKLFDITFDQNTQLTKQLNGLKLELTKCKIKNKDFSEDEKCQSCGNKNCIC